LPRTNAGLDAPLVKSSWRSETAASAEKTVATDCNSRVVGSSAGGRGRRWDRSREIAADHDFGLDDRFSSEHDVLSPDQRGFARHLVTCVLRALG